MQQSYDVAVVGAGITGTAAAYYLSKAGLRVALLERGSIAQEGSGRTLGGVRQSARDVAELPLAMEAVRLWDGLARELGRDVGYCRAGNLRVGVSETQVALLEEIVAQGRSAGLDVELVAGQRLRGMAPALSPDVLAASYCAGDGYVADPVTPARAYAEAAQRHGATVLTGRRVTGVDVAGGRVSGVVTPEGTIGAPTVVLSAGLGTAPLCDGLGLAFPMQARRVQIAVVRTEQPRLAQALGSADAGFSGCPDDDEDCYRLASSSHGEPEDPAAVDDVAPLPDVEAAMMARAGRAITTVTSETVVRRWCGLLDSTPDHKPVVDALSAPRGLVLAAGFSGHGYCLGPISGRLICELILHGQPSLSLAAFRHARFTYAGEDARVAT